LHSTTRHKATWSIDSALAVSRSAAWRILTRRSNDIGDSPKAAENRAMKAARLRPTACDRLWTVCGMGLREGGVIFVKSRFGMRQTSDKCAHHNLACLLRAVFRQERYDV
jgi:hypothetical protein